MKKSTQNATSRDPELDSDQAEAYTQGASDPSERSSDPPTQSVQATDQESLDAAITGRYMRVDDAPIEAENRLQVGWAWPPVRKEERYRVGGWGSVDIRAFGDGLDVMINFIGTADARREAFAFAKALIANVQEQRPGMRADFVSADDHYHVVIQDFGTRDAMMAESFYERLSGRGLFSGQRFGRASSSFTQESHERHSVAGHFHRRR